RKSSGSPRTRRTNENQGAQTATPITKKTDVTGAAGRARRGETKEFSMDTKALIAAYYDAFNAGRTDEMLGYLHDEVEHHVNEGGVRRGKAAFAEFNAHMTRSYHENLTDMVIFANEAGDRAAAEFVVNGTYLATDEGLPEA